MSFVQRVAALTVCSVSVACTSPSDDAMFDVQGAASTADGLAAAGITLHVQAPLSAVPGQALRVTKSDDLSRTAEILPEVCLRGPIKSTLDVNGGHGLGQAGWQSWALRPGRAPAAGFGAAESRTEGFLLSRDRTAPVALREVDAFAEAQRFVPTRVSGLSFSVVQRNAFWLDGTERRVARGDACGDLWVKTASSARFVAVAAALDFPTSDDVQAYRSRFPEGVNEILAPRPELATFLRDHGATLSFHVLVSKELATWLTAKLSGAVCTIDRLDGCADALARVFQAAQGIGALPGNDDTLESVTGPSATWGIYEITSSDFAWAD